MPQCIKKRKRRSFKQQQDTTQMGCGRCGGSVRVAPRKLSRKVSSKLAASLVSVASFNGDKMLHECTGIFVKSLNANTLSVLTSFTLVGYDEGLNYMKYGYRDISRIEVKLPNHQVVNAELVHAHDYYGLAILNIDNMPPGFQPEYLSLDHDVEFKPYVDVVAAWRSHKTGEFKTTTGTLDDIPESGQHYWSSTCKLKTAGLGGALIDYHGNFIGMSSFHGTNTEYLTTCVPLHQILDCFQYFGMLPETGLPPTGGYGTRKGSACETSETQRYSASDIEYFADYLYELATTLGYPLPDPHQACRGMYLKYSFEDEFGQNISSILSKRVAFKVSQSVVSLASFNGKTRFFACTGVFIGHDARSKILTSASLIEVRLPNDRRVKGILTYCNLSYNIAIVDIMEPRLPYGIRLQGHKPVSNGTDIVAVGCLFHNRKLMATKGSLIDKNPGWQHPQSCTELSFSTCKITKAGIGGPLIDMRGNIVGMNFYHEECTPFLSSSIILNLLKNDFSKDICAKCLKDGPVVIAGTNRIFDKLLVLQIRLIWCYLRYFMYELEDS
uniref:Uncharacterized protein n=1 Tax=Avena sativa TaxID=4498 RepID=A0ACD5Y9W5_AVESA